MTPSLANPHPLTSNAHVESARLMPESPPSDSDEPPKRGALCARTSTQLPAQQPAHGTGTRGTRPARYSSRRRPRTAQRPRSQDRRADRVHARWAVRCDGICQRPILLLYVCAHGTPCPCIASVYILGLRAQVLYAHHSAMRARKAAPWIRDCSGPSRIHTRDVIVILPRP